MRNLSRNALHWILAAELVLSCLSVSPFADPGPVSDSSDAPCASTKSGVCERWKKWGEQNLKIGQPQSLAQFYRHYQKVDQLDQQKERQDCSRYALQNSICQTVVFGLLLTRSSGSFSSNAALWAAASLIYHSAWAFGYHRYIREITAFKSQGNRSFTVVVGIAEEFVLGLPLMAMVGQLGATPLSLQDLLIQTSLRASLSAFSYTGLERAQALFIQQKDVNSRSRARKIGSFFWNFVQPLADSLFVVFGFQKSVPEWVSAAPLFLLGAGGLVYEGMVRRKLCSQEFSQESLPSTDLEKKP